MKIRKFRPLAALGLALLMGGSHAFAAPGTKKDAKPAKEGKKGQLKKLADELGLTDTQKEQLKPILKASADARKALRNDATLTPAQKREKSKALREATAKKVGAVLTPEQREKLAALKAKAKTEHQGKGKGDKGAKAAKDV